MGRKSSDEAGWYCRRSEHTAEEATFDQFWSKLGENKAENEMQYVPTRHNFHVTETSSPRYIPEIKKVTLVKELSPTMSIWTLYYNFGMVVSPRVFTVLQVKRLFEDSESPRRAYVPNISIQM